MWLVSINLMRNLVILSIMIFSSFWAKAQIIETFADSDLTTLPTWDGVLENGTKIPVGNYILLLKTFDLEGKVSRTKMAFSVTFNF